MVDKNLFAQDRKPPSPESAAAPAATGKPGMPITNIQLDGVMIKGNSRKALVRMKAASGGQAGKKGASPFMVVRENQQVGDFRVVKIEPKSISLEKDGQNFVISLFAEGKVVPPAAQPPAAAQPPRDENMTPPGQNQQGLPPGVPPNRAHRGQPPQPVPGQAGVEQPQPGAPQMQPQPSAPPDEVGAADEEDDEE